VEISCRSFKFRHFDDGGIRPNNNVKWSNTGGGAFASPSIANGFIYVGTEDGHLYAYDADTGEQRWVINSGTVRGTPAVLGTNLFFGSCDGKLYAVNVETGKEVWNFTTFTFGGMILSSPAVDNERVFLVHHIRMVGCMQYHHLQAS